MLAVVEMIKEQMPQCVGYVVPMSGMYANIYESNSRRLQSW